MSCTCCLQMSNSKLQSALEDMLHTASEPPSSEVLARSGEAGQSNNAVKPGKPPTGMSQKVRAAQPDPCASCCTSAHRAGSAVRGGVNEHRVSVNVVLHEALTQFPLYKRADCNSAHKFTTCKVSSARLMSCH
jgi:hypothetical protein